MNKESKGSSKIADYFYNETGYQKGKAPDKIVSEMDKLWQKGEYVVTIDVLTSIVDNAYPELKEELKSVRGKVAAMMGWALSKNLIIREGQTITILPLPDGQVANKTIKNAKRIIDENLNHLPTKSDCERVIKKVSRSTTETDVDLEELLVELEKDLTEKGKTLKSNWKIITEENLKLWSI